MQPGPRWHRRRTAVKAALPQTGPSKPGGSSHLRPPPPLVPGGPHDSKTFETVGLASAHANASGTQRHGQQRDRMRVSRRRVRSQKTPDRR